MINIAERLAAQAQKARAAPTDAPAGYPQDGEPPAPVEYARAPLASGPQITGGRPPAIQRNSR
jgi:hypothetical protein